MIGKDHNDDIAYFIAFCLEMYKNAHNLTGNETSDIFSRYGVMEFLADNYDVIHTQSPAWILDEINDVIKSK